MFPMGPPGFGGPQPMPPFAMMGPYGPRMVPGPGMNMMGPGPDMNMMGPGPDMNMMGPGPDMNMMGPGPDMHMMRPRPNMNMMRHCPPGPPMGPSPMPPLRFVGPPMVQPVAMGPPMPQMVQPAAMGPPMPQMVPLSSSPFQTPNMVDQFNQLMSAMKVLQQSASKLGVSSPPDTTDSGKLSSKDIVIFETDGNSIKIRKLYSKKAIIQIQIEKFNEQYSTWKSHFDKWKQKHQEHPNKDQFSDYEKQWKDWQLDMIKKKVGIEKELLEIEREIIQLKKLCKLEEEAPVATPPSTSTNKEVKEVKEDVQDGSATVTRLTEDELRAKQREIVEMQKARERQQDDKRSNSPHSKRHKRSRSPEYSRHSRSRDLPKTRRNRDSPCRRSPWRGSPRRNSPRRDPAWGRSRSSRDGGNRRYSPVYRKGGRDMSPGFEPFHDPYGDNRLYDRPVSPGFEERPVYDDRIDRYETQRQFDDRRDIDYVENVDYYDEPRRREFQHRSPEISNSNTFHSDDGHRKFRSNHDDAHVYMRDSVRPMDVEPHLNNSIPPFPEPAAAYQESNTTNEPKTDNTFMSQMESTDEVQTNYNEYPACSYEKPTSLDVKTVDLKTEVIDTSAVKIDETVQSIDKKLLENILKVATGGSKEPSSTTTDIATQPKRLNARLKKLFVPSEITHERVDRELYSRVYFEYHNKYPSMFPGDMHDYVSRYYGAEYDAAMISAKAKLLECEKEDSERFQLEEAKKKSAKDEDVPNQPPWNCPPWGPFFPPTMGPMMRMGPRPMGPPPRWRPFPRMRPPFRLQRPPFNMRGHTQWRGPRAPRPIIPGNIVSRGVHHSQTYLEEHVEPRIQPDRENIGYPNGHRHESQQSHDEMASEGIHADNCYPTESEAIFPDEQYSTNMGSMHSEERENYPRHSAKRQSRKTCLISPEDHHTGRTETMHSEEWYPRRTDVIRSDDRHSRQSNSRSSRQSDDLYSRQSDDPYPIQSDEHYSRQSDERYSRQSEAIHPDDEQYQSQTGVIQSEARNWNSEPRHFEDRPMHSGVHDEEHYPRYSDSHEYDRDRRRDNSDTRSRSYEREFRENEEYPSSVDRRDYNDHSAGYRRPNDIYHIDRRNRIDRSRPLSPWGRDKAFRVDTSHGRQDEYGRDRRLHKKSVDHDRHSGKRFSDEYSRIKQERVVTDDRISPELKDEQPCTVDNEDSNVNKNEKIILDNNAELMKQKELLKVRDPISIDVLLSDPGRKTRSDMICIIIRGIPGSGKSHVAKLIKERESQAGASAPRILCLDDYFMVEVEKVDVDCITGKKTKRKYMEYHYEFEIEDSYRASMFRAFKKTIDDGFFSFIIVDACNTKVRHFDSLYNFAKSKGFEVYVIELNGDPHVCANKNLHGHSLETIQMIAKGWEPTPVHFLRLDVRSMLQDTDIEDVEMSIDNDDPSVPNISGKEAPPDEDGVESSTNCSMQKFIMNSFQHYLLPKSKWEENVKEEKLAKLDGIKKGSKKHSMDDFLSLTDDYDTRMSDPNKKRVRWADIEEQRDIDRHKALGFVVGYTNWDKVTGTVQALDALEQTRFFEKDDHRM